MQTIVGLVAAGCGVSIVPGSVGALTGLGAVFADLLPTTPQVELALAVPRQGVSPVAANFVAVARDVTSRKRPLSSMARSAQEGPMRRRPP